MNKKEKKVKIRKLLNRLFKLHKYYLTLDNMEQNKLVGSCKPIFIKLKKLGISTSFSLTFLVYGNKFLKREYKMTWQKMRTK